MPKGVFIRTAEHKKKISKALKGIRKPEMSARMMGNKIGIGNKNNLGNHWKMSDESKKKISDAHKKSGLRPPSNKGKSHSLNHREHLSESHRKRREQHWSWKGGVSPLVQIIRRCFKYRQWRSDVFTRDNFTCVLCGKRGGELEADHYPKKFSTIFHENKIRSLEEAFKCEEFWNINNGRTLCRDCHDKTK